jgi:hypothetical protein
VRFVRESKSRLALPIVNWVFYVNRVYVLGCDAARRQRRRIALAASWVATMLAMCGCGRLGFDVLSDASALSADADRGINGDVDGDMVVDDDDNCPNTMNADQANEDGDSFGDLCDPCPPIADLAVFIDDDNDGISNACDPRPTTAGDVITVFEGFTRASPGATLDGVWTFANGTAVVTSAIDRVSALTWPIAARMETVSTFVTIDSLHGDLTARPVGVIHQFEAGTPEGITCVFGVNPSNAQVVAIASIRNSSALTTFPTTANVGSSRGFTSQRDANAYKCNDTQGASLRASSALTSNPDRVGLFSRSVSARFDWVMIVASP